MTEALSSSIQTMSVCCGTGWQRPCPQYRPCLCVVVLGDRGPVLNTDHVCVLWYWVTEALSSIQTTSVCCGTGYHMTEALSSIQTMSVCCGTGWQRPCPQYRPRLCVVVLGDRGPVLNTDHVCVLWYWVTEALSSIQTTSVCCGTGWQRPCPQYRPRLCVVVLGATWQRPCPQYRPCLCLVVLGDRGPVLNTDHVCVLWYWVTEALSSIQTMSVYCGVTWQRPCPQYRPCLCVVVLGDRGPVLNTDHVCVLWYWIPHDIGPVLNTDHVCVLWYWVP